MNLPSSRIEARRVGAKHFFTGVPCANGHVVKKIASSGACMECSKARSKRYFENNKEKIRARNRELRKLYPERWRRNRTKWAATYPGGLNEVARIYRYTFGGRVSAMLRDARSRAAQRGAQCDLTREWIGERLKLGTCELTGLPFELGPRGKSKTQPFAPSLDRKDPSKGYLQENTRMVLWAVNMALADHGEEVFAKIATAFLAKRGLT